MALSSIIKQKCKVCNQTAIEKSRIAFGDYKLITLQCGHVTSEDSLATSDYESLSSDKNEKLMPFQIDGVKFIESSDARCLIADEQGLGKSIQAAAALKLHLDKLTPAVICCKTTLKAQWMHVIFSWVGTRKVQVIQTSKEIAVPGFDIYIITYDILKNEKVFDYVDIKTIIIDECQAIKNHLSGRAKAVQKIAKGAEHIIALSGTPIKNHAGEYFTILNLLRPAKFPEYRSFITNYCDSYETMYGYKVGGLSSPDYFREATSDFIIRRTQSEVLPDLFALKQPRKFHHVELDPKLNSAYRDAQKELEELYYRDEDENTMTNMLAIYAKMRKVTGISKVFDCVDYVSDFLLSTDRKIVVFAHHHSTVNLLEDKINSWLTDGGYAPAVIYRAGDDKIAKLNQFSEPNARVMVLSTLAAGEGMDGLQHLCSDMILLERQWNPANEEQVEARLARIGQTKPVNFIYMIATGTIDDFFTKIIEEKRAIFSSVIDGIETQWDQSSLMKELMTTLVTLGKNAWSL